MPDTLTPTRITRAGPQQAVSRSPTRRPRSPPADTPVTARAARISPSVVVLADQHTRPVEQGALGQEQYPGDGGQGGERAGRPPGGARGAVALAWALPVAIRPSGTDPPRRAPVATSALPARAKWMVRLSPTATAPLPIAAPRSTPPLHPAWRPLRSGRVAVASSCTPAPFMDTSSTPMARPMARSPAISPAHVPARPGRTSRTPTARHDQATTRRDPQRRTSRPPIHAPATAPIDRPRTAVPSVPSRRSRSSRMSGMRAPQVPAEAPRATKAPSTAR